MKFSVPSSSASPQRPQLDTSPATRRKSVRLATMLPFLEFARPPRRRCFRRRPTALAPKYSWRLDYSGKPAPRPVLRDRRPGPAVWGCRRESPGRTPRSWSRIGVSVTPGPVQLIRIPRRAKCGGLAHGVQDDRFLGQPVAPVGQRVGMAMCTNRFRRHRRGVAAAGGDLADSPDMPCAASDETLTIDDPAGIFVRPAPR